MLRFVVVHHDFVGVLALVIVDGVLHEGLHQIMGLHFFRFF